MGRLTEMCIGLPNSMLGRMGCICSVLPLLLLCIAGLGGSSRRHCAYPCCELHQHRCHLHGFYAVSGGFTSFWPAVYDAHRNLGVASPTYHLLVGGITNFLSPFGLTAFAFCRSVPPLRASGGTESAHRFHPVRVGFAAGSCLMRGVTNCSWRSLCPIG
mgnify:CR=1 FL=1